MNKISSDTHSTIRSGGVAHQATHVIRISLITICNRDTYWEQAENSFSDWQWQWPYKKSQAEGQDEG